MLVPVGKRLIVAPVGDEKRGAIYVVGKKGSEATQLPRMGKVVSVNPECRLDADGKVRNSPIPAEGDTIAYSGWVTAEVEDGVNKFVVVGIDDVLAIRK